MTIEVREEQFERAKLVLSNVPKGIERAMASAINRAAQSGRTEAVKKVRERYIVKASTVREPLKIERASSSSPIAILRAVGRVIPLSKFKIRPSKPTPGRSKPVTATVIKGKGGTIPKAFVARMPTGHVGVYRRKGRPRLPIMELYGPSVPQMIGNEEVMRALEEKAQQTLDERMEHDITRLLEGIK